MGTANITIFSASAHEGKIRLLWKTGKQRNPCTFEKFTGPEKLGPGTILLLDVSHESDLQILRLAHKANAATLAVLTNPERLKALIREEYSAMLLPSFDKDDVNHALWKAIRQCVEKHDPKKISTTHEVIRNYYRKVETHEHPATVNNYKYEIPLHAGQVPQVFLTNHEIGLLTSLAKGKLYKEIADEFCITIGTVKQNLHRIYEKLKVNNKVEAINYLHKYELGKL
ncbi:MAG: response regulator transcription factor [Saprospiraceae bacterium]|nr:response regulator transcription factor [Saprospiraceae bacterium]MBK9688789.1 response regulator transcription factor [Saprospiraceae bacterium]MBL0083021.1 response regulator transcription factor [Saprospiraceae bacterium]